jgi:hypothetical protein
MITLTLSILIVKQIKAKVKLRKISSKDAPWDDIIKMAVKNNRNVKRARASSFYFGAATPQPHKNSINGFDYNEDNIQNKTKSPNINISDNEFCSFSFQNIPELKEQSKEN